jgi:predicted nucleic acid-binding protein
MGNENGKQKWYYDACTLDKKTNIYHEIINRTEKRSIISHLAIGEAYGSCRVKGADQASAFIELIRSLDAHIEVVGNDIKRRGVDIATIKDAFPKLTLSDLVHLATAIDLGCSIMKTSDCHLYDLPVQEVKELSEKMSGTPLVIERM